MPDIGLLQGAPPKRRAVPPRAPAETGAAAFAAPVEAIAARYAALPEQAISVEVQETGAIEAAAAEAVAATDAGAAIEDVTPPVVSAASHAAPPADDSPKDSAANTPPPVIPAATRTVPPIPARDLLWLALALLVIIGTGLGIRDPWPADEPRFAAIARDMVATGEWLFPRVGGDLYQDKPPLFFWMVAVCYSVLGSIKWSFLIPSFLASGSILFLVYDFGRRLVSREAGFAAALTLVCTLHFVMVMRGAQIDPVLCGLVTLSLYALLRHLLLGPAWGWYFIGGFFAGLGIITKGVGFLPLLVLLPFFLMRAFRWRGLASIDAGVAGWRWWLAPLGMLLATSLWFVPMILAVDHSGLPEYKAYRDEILFRQTVGRYAAAWHHVKAWYYFIVEVIPPLWLPWTILLFWLVPRFKSAFKERDARVWLPLTWLLLVLLFFSISPGKRGVYIHVALPALALASLPLLPEVFARPGVRRAGWALALFLFGAVLLALVAVLLGYLNVEGLPVIPLLVTYLVLCGAGLWIAHRRAPLAAWPVALGTLCIAFSYALAPAMNPDNSASQFTHDMLAKVKPDEELALVAYKEQFLLYLDRPTVNFGHRRFLEGPQEAYDAAAWLNAAEHRVLLVPQDQMKECFPDTSLPAGETSDEQWYLVHAPASSACAEKGVATRAIHYDVQSLLRAAR